MCFFAGVYQPELREHHLDRALSQAFAQVSIHPAEGEPEVGSRFQAQHHIPGLFQLARTGYSTILVLLYSYDYTLLSELKRLTKITHYSTNRQLCESTAGAGARERPNGRCAPILASSVDNGTVEQKQDRERLIPVPPLCIAQNYGMELEQVQQLYEKQKHDPPISRNLPPVAGNITWSRQGGVLSLNGTDIRGKSGVKARGAVTNQPKNLELTAKQNVLISYY